MRLSRPQLHRTGPREVLRQDANDLSRLVVESLMNGIESATRYLEQDASEAA